MYFVHATGKSTAIKTTTETLFCKSEKVDPTHFGRLVVIEYVVLALVILFLLGLASAARQYLA